MVQSPFLEGLILFFRGLIRFFRGCIMKFSRGCDFLGVPSWSKVPLSGLSNTLILGGFEIFYFQVVIIILFLIIYNPRSYNGKKNEFYFFGMLYFLSYAY